MRRTSSLAMAALAGMAAAAGMASIADPAGRSRQQVAEAPAAKAQQQAPAQQAPGDAKATRLTARRYARWGTAPRGKRYSASVRQHQRHAAKARRRQAERRRSR